MLQGCMCFNLLPSSPGSASGRWSDAMLMEHGATDYACDAR